MMNIFQLCGPNVLKRKWGEQLSNSARKLIDSTTIAPQPTSVKRNSLIYLHQETHRSLLNRITD